MQAGKVGVTIPPGALASPVPVTLKRTAPGADFGNQSAAWSYTLVMPQLQVGQDIPVVFSGFGGPDRRAAVALADSSTTSGQTVAVPARLVWGDVVAGALRFHLPADELAGGGQAAAAMAADTATASGEKRSFSWWSVTNVAQKTSQHFTLEYPTAIIGVSPDAPERILAAAEDAYQKLADLHFDLPGSLNWPMSITVKYGMGEREGETGIPLSGKKNSYLNLSADICGSASSEKMRTTVGHEIFHAIQSAYDPRGSLTIRHSWSTPYFLMLSEASSTWFERKVMGGGAYVSPQFLTNMDMKSTGLEMWQDKPEAQNLGYWASGFLRFLTDKYQDAFILTLWQKVRGQKNSSLGYSDLRALMDAVGSGIDTSFAWNDFVGKVVSGTTGYSGWTLPASNAVWYNVNPFAGVFSEDIAPFSALKWTAIFNTSRTSMKYMFNVTAESPDISYTLYKANDANGPFTFVTSLKPFTPQTVTVGVGDIYVMAVANSDAASPYKTRSTAQVIVGNSEVCRFCPDVSRDAVLDVMPGGYKVWWDSTREYQQAVEYYWDYALGNVYFCACYWPGSNYLKSRVTFFENGANAAVDQYDESGQRHGRRTIYYETGGVWYIEQYVHGRIQARSFYTPSGELYWRCTYDAQGAETCGAP
ncbi:toxin-antitoxin system YwqK family antitoxin [Fundidesulfovibrio soli]|uniref:toxin-antitoxin system YwqK family antitoxin n=1 Tax=Fundidesulfovibrio soli TaxID=2922716 RepID=UPI001FAFB37E|nr:hypothetical protein [Fundidesulfovibrio soli]